MTRRRIAQGYPTRADLGRFHYQVEHPGDAHREGFSKRVRLVALPLREPRPLGHGVHEVVGGVHTAERGGNGVGIAYIGADRLFTRSRCSTWSARLAMLTTW